MIFKKFIDKLLFRRFNLFIYRVFCSTFKLSRKSVKKDFNLDSIDYSTVMYIRNNDLTYGLSYTRYKYSYHCIFKYAGKVLKIEYEKSVDGDIDSWILRDELDKIIIISDTKKEFKIELNKYLVSTFSEFTA